MCVCVCVRLSEITQSTHTSGSDIGKMTSDADLQGDGVVLTHTLLGLN